MTLNSSGPISLGGSTSGQSINLELGQSATAQISLNDTNVRTLAGVPSGAIVVPTNFYGKSSVVVDFNDQVISGTQGGAAQAGYWIFGAGGNIGKAYEFVNFGSATFLEQWITPTTTAGDYEVYATVSGDTPTGTLNSWVALSGNPSWSLDAYGSGTLYTCTLTFQVRKTGTATVLDTWYVSLTAEAY